MRKNRLFLYFATMLFSMVVFIFPVNAENAIVWDNHETTSTQYAFNGTTGAVCSSFVPTQSGKAYSFTQKSASGCGIDTCISETPLTSAITSGCAGFVHYDFGFYETPTILFNASTAMDLVAGNTYYICQSSSGGDVTGNMYYPDKVGSTFYKNGSTVGGYDVGLEIVATLANVCGDGNVAGDETCDDGENNGEAGYCNLTCDGDAPYCGDGTIDEGETCDDGENNGEFGYCDLTCSYVKVTIDFFPCELPENTLIQRKVGCVNIYRTSTTTADEVQFYYEDRPILLYAFMFSIFAVIFAVLYIYILLNKKR